MSYIRTSTFTLPRDEGNTILPGTAVYNALVPARRYVAQSIDGLIQQGMWRTTNAVGKFQFVIFTEWNTLEDVQAYANNTHIKEMEELLGTEENPLLINVYENIG